MKILSQTALLAGTIMFLTVMASSASCQDGLQSVDAQPGQLQALPEWSNDEAAAGAAAQSCANGCDHQGACSCGPQAIYGRPRGFIGRSHGCACGGAGGPGCLAHLGAGISQLGSLHSDQPLIDPWARADWIASQRAATQSWHPGYYHTGWGAPVALVVPPTARMQTRMGWGVSQTTMTPIYHQFERPYPSAVTADGSAVPGACLPLRPTPRWPSHTDQFGVYSVRGPW
jgi:hypothetical protein